MRGSRRRRSLVLCFREDDFSKCSCSFCDICHFDSSNVSNCITEDTSRWTQMNSFCSQLELSSTHTGDMPTIHKKKTITFQLWVMTLQILRSLFSWGEGGGFVVFFDNLVNVTTTNFGETHKKHCQHHSFLMNLLSKSELYCEYSYISHII